MELTSTLSLESLWPRPRSAAAHGEGFALTTTPTISTRGSREIIEPPLAWLEERLRGLGLAPRRVEEERAAIRLGMAPGELPPQGYRLRVDARGAELVGADRPGLFHAVATFLQWLEVHPPPPGQIGGLEVIDHPDFAHRGAMLDVSRNKVPTMATLFDLVELLAGLKLNQLQLYTEHTFAYRGHEVVWRDASPMTGEEVRMLDAFCRARGIELVPNQNSFGHFHRWLVHAPYRRLAECPEGILHPFSLEPEPFSLCPLDPGSLALLADLYDQLLPHFTSGMLNVGLDETLDLGLCRSAEACAERGKERVYLGFVHAVHRLVAARGRRMQLWGDVILSRPELIPELPRDAIALEWGYEADHPFADDAARFAASGLDFYVCPGTSSWNSFGGRTSNALANLARAAHAGREHGALGYLITDWGDHGHLQPLPVSYFGLLGGAGFAWNAAAAIDVGGLARHLDRHVFRDPAREMGRAFAELGELYRDTGVRHPNGSALFYLVVFPQCSLAHERLRGLDREGLERVLEKLAEIRRTGAGARMARADAGLIERELAWVADALELGAKMGRERLGQPAEAPLGAILAPSRARLAERLTDLIERLPEIWHARNRPGGLAGSVGRLGRTLELLQD